MLILDLKAPLQGSPQPLGHEPLEQLVHVQHERRGLCLTDGVLQRQVRQHQLGQPQRGPVVLVEPGEHHTVVVGGTVPHVAYVLEGDEVLHQPAPVDGLHSGHPQ